MICPTGNLTANPGSGVGSSLKFSSLIKIKFHHIFNPRSELDSHSACTLHASPCGQSQTSSAVGRKRPKGRGQPSPQWTGADGFIRRWEQRRNAGSVPGRATTPSRHALPTQASLTLGRAHPSFPPHLSKACSPPSSPFPSLPFPDGGKGGAGSKGNKLARHVSLI